MPDIRIRTQYQLGTWLVCEEGELFEIVLSTPYGSKLVIHPPQPFARGLSSYSEMVENIKDTYDAGHITIDISMRRDPKTTYPDENISIREVRFDKEHELYPYVSHATTVSKEYANRVLALLRWRTNQSWLGRGGHQANLDSRFACLPESNRGPHIGKTMEISGSGPVGFLYPGEDFQLLGNTLWRRVAQDLYGDVSPELHDELLLDAHFFLHGGDLRRCTLEAAIACELFARKKMRTLASDQSDPVLKDVLRSGSFVERFLHLGPHYLRSRSLKEEAPDLWRRVKELFEARNKAAHPEEWDSFSKSTGKGYLDTAYKTIAWIESL